VAGERIKPAAARAPVLVPDAWSVLVNPRHHDAAGLRLGKTEKVPLDPQHT
jgi:hypothetical protein